MDKEMIMASERFGNIEDLSYKDDISLFFADRRVQSDAAVQARRFRVACVS